MSLDNKMVQTPYKILGKSLLISTVSGVWNRGGSAEETRWLLLVL